MLITMETVRSPEASPRSERRTQLDPRNAGLVFGEVAPSPQSEETSPAGQSLLPSSVPPALGFSGPRREDWRTRIMVL